MFQPSLAYIVGDPFHFPQAYVRASHYERRASRPQTVAPYPKRQSMNGHLISFSSCRCLPAPRPTLNRDCRPPQWVLGRSVGEMAVDVDVSVEGGGKAVSRVQCVISLSADGHFRLHNRGRRPVVVDGVMVARNVKQQCVVAGFPRPSSEGRGWPCC